VKRSNIEPRVSSGAVPPVETTPFAEEFLDGAAALLAERHRRHRQAEPLLPEHDARAELEALWRRDGASGAVALRDGRPTAFVVGVPKSEETWGPNVWIESAGHAAAEPEDLRDAYGAAAALWVESDRTRHYLLVPASDGPLVDAWFRLSFGHQQSHGILESSEREVAVPDGFSIRPPAVEEIEGLIDVDLALPSHQLQSPVFSGYVRPYSRDDSRAEWEEIIAGSDEHVLIGYQGDKPVACWSITDWSSSRHSDGLMQAERAAYIAFAVTLPEARGSGIGRALTDAVVDWAAREGYPIVVTDWRETNLLASRFWPHRGFRRYFLRLYRSIP
jgi:ribosomal protein S18 acetylase RimI-like enzyme